LDTVTLADFEKVEPEVREKSAEIECGGEGVLKGEADVERERETVILSERVGEEVEETLCEGLKERSEVADRVETVVEE